jgi:hypothetical protein
MDLVGIGRVKLELTVQGLEPEDWDHLDSVEAQVQRPSGAVDYIPADQITIDKENRKVSFVYQIVEAGEHTVPLKLNFAGDDGTIYFQITYQPYKFRAVSYWR